MDEPAMPIYSLLSSTRYDNAVHNMHSNTRVNGALPSPFMLLPYHFDRLMTAARTHGWQMPENVTKAALLEKCERAVAEAGEAHGLGPLKVRILLDSEGTLTAAASPATPLESSDFLTPPSESRRVLYVDTEPTPTSRFTRTKTTRRTVYNTARARAGLTPLPTPSDAHIDVLLYTPDGLITETSIRNVAFMRGGVWVTPCAESGCLPGVVRRLLLEEGRVVEGDIRKDEIQQDEVVLTFNGVEGCCLARLVLPVI